MADVWKFRNITQTFHTKVGFIATLLNRFPLNKLRALLLFMKFLSSCNNTVNNVLYSEHTKLFAANKSNFFLFMSNIRNGVYILSHSHTVWGVGKITL